MDLSTGRFGWASRLMRSMEMFRDVRFSDAEGAFDSDMAGFPCLRSFFSAIWSKRLLRGVGIVTTSMSYLARVANRAWGNELFIVSCTCSTVCFLDKVLDPLTTCFVYGCQSICLLWNKHNTTTHTWYVVLEEVFESRPFLKWLSFLVTTVLGSACCSNLCFAGRSLL